MSYLCIRVPIVVFTSSYILCFSFVDAYFFVVNQIDSFVVVFSSGLGRRSCKSSTLQSKRVDSIDIKKNSINRLLT